MISLSSKITWCKRCTIAWSISVVPSTIPVIGLWNHCLKSSRDAKTLGMRKWSKAHNSINEFWRGVPERELWNYGTTNLADNLPVNNSLRRDRRPSKFCQAWLLKFLMFWASSRIRYCQAFFLKARMSWIASLYEVMHTWKALFLDQPWQSK